MEIGALIKPIIVQLSPHVSGNYPASIYGEILAVSGAKDHVGKKIWICAVNEQVRQQVVKICVDTVHTYRIKGKIINDGQQQKHIVFYHIENNQEYFKGFVTLCDSQTPF